MLRSLADVVATAALVLVMWVSCAGIGTRILPRRADGNPSGADPPEPASWNRPGLAAIVGLSVLVAFGGVGTLLHLPFWLIVGPFTVVGLALAGLQVARSAWRPVSGPVAWIVGLTVGAFVLVALVESRIGATLQINTCDELRAYLPMVRRLLDTNAIVEPWSYRRLQNLGGFTYIQAIPVSVFGNVGIAFAETVVASVFLAGFFVSTGFRSRWARVGALLAILAIPVLWIPRINAAPVLAVIPLLLGTFAVTAELRGSIRRGARDETVRWAIAAGLVLAAVASVRTPILPAAALTVAIGALTASAAPMRARWRVLGVAVGSAFAAIVSWLLAAWESVGTPLYPLLPGNANPSVPSERDPDALSSLGHAFSHTMRYLNGGTYFWVTVAILVIAILARKVLPDASLVVIVAGVSIASILVFTVSLSMASVRDFGRYIGPMASSLAVFLVYEAVRVRDAAPPGADRRASFTGALATGVALVCAVAVFTPFAVDTPKLTITPAGLDLLRWSPKRLPNAVYADEVTPPGSAADMKRAVAHVNPRHTILAVDRPYLVDTGKDDLPNMDLPGWATPTASFPFFHGTAAKVAYLRKQGYTTLIATEPARDVCLAPPFRRYEERHAAPPDSIYARYFLDWSDDVSQLERRAPDAIRRFGDLRVIDLPRATAALRARSS